MSPIDDELRTALSSRTDAVELSPDFFTGVERRAKGLRRRRVAATVAGSALAVSALGLGGPVVASLVTTGSDRSAVDVAGGPETAQPAPVARYALDPAAPWEYRGDALDQGTVDTTAREWGTARGVAEDDVRLSPLYAETSGGESVLVFVARADGVEPRWGVARSSESGPDLLVDEPVGTDTYALPWAFTDGGTDRLLVVAAPETTLEYGADTASEWRAMEDVSPGVGATDLDGDQAADQVRVVGPDGQPLTMLAAPSPAGSAEPGASPAPAPEDEGPGTETPVDVDAAPYALDVEDAWAYRGPTELGQHPNLAVDDLRLFQAAGTGRSTGDWADRPLLAVERPDGLSVLMVLHFRGDEAWVTTTWQRQDEAPRQAEQAVRDGTLVVQSFLPQSDGTGVLVALAAPRVGAIETPALREQAHNEDGWALWETPADVPAGELFLYSEGDGLLFHTEALRRS